jgi:hypothetical protein
MTPATQPTGTPVDYSGAADYASDGYPSGQTDYGAMAAPGSSANPYAGPQQGYYDPATAYAGAAPQKVTPADPSRYVDQASPYNALDRSSYARGGAQNYGAMDDTSGQYGNPAVGAPNYVAELDRQTGAKAGSLGDQPFRSYYDGGAGNGGSSAAGATNPSQYNPYNNSYGAAKDGPVSNSVANDYSASANPLGTADYSPGRTGYTPGDTGYSPEGVAPYQPATGAYVPPSGSWPTSPPAAPYATPSVGATGTGSSAGGQSYNPYLPGSIKPYTRGTMGASSAPSTSQIGNPTGTDDGVQAAGYLQTPETRRL